MVRSGRRPTTRVGPVKSVISVLYGAVARIRQIAGSQLIVVTIRGGVVSRVDQVLVRDDVDRAEDHEVIRPQHLIHAVDGGLVLPRAGGVRHGLRLELAHRGCIVNAHLDGFQSSLLIRGDELLDGGLQLVVALAPYFCFRTDMLVNITLSLSSAMVCLLDFEKRPSQRSHLPATLMGVPRADAVAPTFPCLDREPKHNGMSGTSTY